MVRDKQGQQVDWGAVLEGLLGKHNTDNLDYADAVKKAVKAARNQHANLDKKALKQGLQSFLSSGSGAHIVRDGKVLRKPGRKLAKPEDSHPLSGVTEGTHAAAAALAALADREDQSPQSQKEAPKRRKLPAAAAVDVSQHAAAGSAQEVIGAAEVAVQQTGGGGGKDQTKHKKLKRAAAGGAGQPAVQQATLAAAEAPVEEASGAVEKAAAKGKGLKANKQAAKETQQQQEHTQQVADAAALVIQAPPEQAAPERRLRQAIAGRHDVEDAQPAADSRTEPPPLRQFKRSGKKAGSKRKAEEDADAEVEAKAARAVGAAEEKQGQRQAAHAAVREGSLAGPILAQQEQHEQGEQPAAAVAGPVAVIEPESGREGQGQEQQPAKKKRKGGKAAPALRQDLEGEEHEEEQLLLPSNKKQRKGGAAVEEPERHQQPKPAAVSQEQEAAGAQARQRGTPQQSQPNGGAAARPASEGKVLPPGAESDVKRWREANKRQDVKSGPFSQAEKDTLRQAVVEYAEVHGHSTTDFSWLFDATKKRAKRDQGVWSVIAEALPHRTYKSVWGAGMRMFHPGNYQGRFTVDEDARLAQLVAERGTKWKEIGAALGRMPDACKDRWKDIRLGSEKKLGRWTDEETAKLKEAVEEYMKLHKAAQQPTGTAAAGEVQVSLSSPTEGAGAGAGADRPLFEEDEGKEGGAAAAAEGGKGGAASARRQVLDDIDWGLVSRKVGSRSQVQCLEKWYSQLCPSMVDRGEWGAGDDRRLLRAVYRGGAAQDFELDWDKLVPGRAAQQVRRRWRLMLKCVPGARNLGFGEIVEYLVEAYMPQLKQQQGASPHQQQQQQQQQRKQQQAPKEERQPQREQVDAMQRQQRQRETEEEEEEEEEGSEDGSQG